jgi:hypothetical protein
MAGHIIHPGGVYPVGFRISALSRLALIFRAKEAVGDCDSAIFDSCLPISSTTLNVKPT